jgi:hypothetical protein
MPCNPSLSHHLAERHSIQLRKFGGFAERKRSLRIERDGKFGPESLRNLPFGNAETLEHRVRDIQAHPHATQYRASAAESHHQLGRVRLQLPVCAGLREAMYRLCFVVKTSSAELAGQTPACRRHAAIAHLFADFG